MTLPQVNETIYDGFGVHFSTSYGNIWGHIKGDHEGRLLIEENPSNYSKRIIIISRAYLHRLAEKDRISPAAYFRAQPTLKYLKVFTCGDEK